MKAVNRERLPPLGPLKSFELPAIQKQTLDSGLRVWTVELRHVPVLSVIVLLPVGSGVDPEVRPGLASLAADMLDEGSQRRSALDIHKALAGLGAHIETEVGPDATVLKLTTLSKNTGPALTLLEETIAQPAFPSADFDRVRTLRLSRLLQLRAMPAAVADRVFLEQLYVGHPYGHVPLGTEEMMEIVQRDEVIAFYRQHYRPSAATIIGAGDLAHSTFVNDIAATFAEWRDPLTLVSRERSGEDRVLPVEPRLSVVDRPGSAQSEIRVGQVGPSRETPDYHALLVLNTVLGGQFVSRLNLKLREEKGYTYGARTSFDFRRGCGPFMLQVAVQTDVTAAAIGDAFAELTAIRDDRPPSVEEVELAQASLTRGYARNFETADHIARAASQMALHGLPDDYFNRFVSDICAIQPDQVALAARKHLDPARMLTVIVGDREVVEPTMHLS